MNKKIIIYGATGAVGSQTARLLSKEGCDLHLVGKDQDPLLKLSEELAASYSLVDLTDPAAFDQVKEEAGKGLDGLVYAVGTINLKSIGRLTPEDYLADYKLNALGPALAVRASYKALKRSKNDPSVVFYSSVAVQQGLALHASLSMSKGAVEGLTRALAAELAPAVRINAVAPSLLGDSPLSAPILADEKAKKDTEAGHALKRLGRAEDIAQATVYLLSDKASWVTGQIIGVDGGRSVIQA